MTERIRLSKHLARLLPCSRREAELYIQGGWVLVDGEVVEEPQFRVSDQHVELHPQARAEPLEPATMLLHQPAEIDADDPLQLIASETHAPDDSSGVRTLQSHFSRLHSALPLQPGASGLAAFTQDRRVLRKLTEDAERIEQEYNIEVTGELVPGGLDVLKRGLHIDGRALPPIKASWQSEARLRFALKNPLPDQIRLACEQVGLRVLTMKRIRIGRVPLSKLPPGQWRYLRASERF